MIRRKLLPIFVLAALLAPTVAQADASTSSNKVDVTLSGTVLQFVTLTCAVPTVLFGNVTPGATNTATLPLSLISAWNLGAGQTLTVYAYFDSATTAMTGTVTGQLLPTSLMKGSVNGGAQQGFSSSSPFTTGNTAMSMFSVAITAANLVSTRTDSLAMTLDLTTRSSLPADVYTGTMHLQAQAL